MIMGFVMHIGEHGIPMRRAGVAKKRVTLQIIALLFCGNPIEQFTEQQHRSWVSLTNPRSGIQARKGW